MSGHEDDPIKDNAVESPPARLRRKGFAHRGRSLPAMGASGSAGRRRNAHQLKARNGTVSLELNHFELADAWSRCQGGTSWAVLRVRLLVAAHALRSRANFSTSRALVDRPRTPSDNATRIGNVNVHMKPLFGTALCKRSDTFECVVDTPALMACSSFEIGCAEQLRAYRGSALIFALVGVRMTADVALREIE